MIIAGDIGIFRVYVLLELIQKNFVSGAKYEF